MLYHTTPLVEQFGLVRFRNWKVLELGRPPDGEAPIGPGVIWPRREDMDRTLGQLAIVVPIRNERIKFLDGVLSGIPRTVRVIVVSNSSRTPVDRFRIEREALSAFCRATGRRVTLLHQRDAQLGKTLQDAGYGDLLDEEGLVAHGKGESMAVGVLAALSGGADYIGFIDSDNYVPGAVLEHVWNYAAVFALIPSPHVCVREVWHFKPKVRGSIYFTRAGRVSRVTNHFLNELIAQRMGFDTEEVRTANAGEHAFSAQLALRMPLASGYAVEPWELRWMLEEWGGVLDRRGPRNNGVDVVQVETRNPHFHEDKGDDHIADMVAASLGVLYHSELATPAFKTGVLRELERHGWRAEPPVPRPLPAPSMGEVKRFAAWMEDVRDDIVVGSALVA